MVTIVQFNEKIASFCIIHDFYILHNYFKLSYKQNFMEIYFTYNLVIYSSRNLSNHPSEFSSIISSLFSLFFFPQPFQESVIYQCFANSKPILFALLIL